MNPRSQAYQLIKKAMNRRRVAPDGACMFNSVHLLTSNLEDEEDVNAAQTLRCHCAKVIEENEEMYTDVFLDKPRSRYLEWILNPVNYGGENEILILANLKRVNICVVSFENLAAEEALLLTYPCQDVASSKKIYMLYSGQHYDAIVLPSTKEEEAGTAAFDQKVFDAAEGSEEQVKYDALARSLGTTLLREKAKDMITRQRIKIKCISCGYICEDAKGFQDHAEGFHGDDDDYDYMCENITVEEIVASAEDN